VALCLTFPLKWSIQSSRVRLQLRFPFLSAILPIFPHSVIACLARFYAVHDPKFPMFSCLPDKFCRAGEAHALILVEDHLEQLRRRCACTWVVFHEATNEMIYVLEGLIGALAEMWARGMCGIS